MTVRLPADLRRSQLIEAGLTVAAEAGIAAVTVRAVAEHAEASLGVVHYCFENKEALVTAMGEALVQELGAAVGTALHAAAADGRRDCAGPRALREILHRGVAALWSVIESTADRQLLTYEITAYSVRSAGAGPGIGTLQYRVMDTETESFLEAAAEASRMRWTEPMASLTRSALATIDGVVLRWLVDQDTLAVIAELDDLAARIAAKAVPS
ncbi:TetR family transcriptional regulator [Rhodococcus sp. BP-149]|uniref:TetR/AcrR family transcriptional regulator n=1 Tax=unclassified Rhodococcus (in: high G+C Gram-positive bacteria) TaxID=192944 RepID=UPI001C9B5787|nr:MULTISPECIES: TetR family transcriptional regulator [unclassified Rhodococcus (in: high G+C Gram-positive bacteria)]MBY6685169.1 TetR family transcriptional regulator [Rhodococcus sp. BP-288]MBY6692347.1 TetR family transcriptional regulator [Rhodococcus sp. BP-188]MBY6698245.1 TetR family transcriptional regulator [Rhodococcus sp. BP-285]MBY6700925.1 TetR family transcriptional regulator [Rhodococcus sp. BP-283]MBY6711925.1 TetR family transcriptional regulator [Rhodococcus sp. BP-160]